MHGGHGIEGKNVFYEESHTNPDDMLLEKQTASAANRPARSFCRSLSYDAFTHGNERPNTFNRTILRLEPALPARENTYSPGNHSTLLLLRPFRPDIRQTRHPYFPIHLCSSIRKREKTQTWLYDRKNNPDQLHNLASRKPSLCDSLNQKLLLWLEQTHDPFSSYLKP